MPYTGVMAQVGFDLIEDAIKIIEGGNCKRIGRYPFNHYEQPYILLCDIDVEPIVLESEEMFERKLSQLGALQQATGKSISCSSQWWLTIP